MRLAIVMTLFLSTAAVAQGSTNAEAVTAAFSVSALITGGFACITGGLFWVAKNWIEKVNANLEEQSDKILLLEESRKYFAQTMDEIRKRHHDQMNAFLLQLVKINEKLDEARRDARG